ncbi:hypothetical protein ACNONS_03530 [Bacteroides xylanisolvens]|uniref:hypothetical protein n=1 Tax=Bacteroides TaxID=816 RepID=UPI00124468E0
MRPTRPDTTDRAVKTLTVVEACASGGEKLPINGKHSVKRGTPTAGVISGPFLKLRKAHKQQEYPECTVMFNKRAESGTVPQLIKHNCYSGFPAQTLKIIRKTGRLRRKQHHVCTHPKDGGGCLLPQYKSAQS